MELTARGSASSGCDLFISLHLNACGTKSVDRTESIHFVSRDGTNVDDRSKEIASMLAQTVYEVVDNDQRPKVYSKLAGSDRNRDGVKNDNYYGVLHGAWMVGTPGIILEHSFHTNAQAAKWLLDEGNLQKLAAAEAKTIAEWFDVSNKAAPAEPQKSAPHWVLSLAGRVSWHWSGSWPWHWITCPVPLLPARVVTGPAQRQEPVCGIRAA